MNIFFIQNHNDYNDYYSYESERHKIEIINGLEVLLPNSVLRKAIRIHCSPKFHLPFTQIWTRRMIKSFVFLKEQKKPLLIFSADYYSLFSRTRLFETLKKKYSCYIILSFKDRVQLYLNKHCFKLDKAKTVFDLVTTYNEEDSLKYGLLLEHLTIPSIQVNDFLAPNRDIDVFFVGQDKGRIEQINSTFEMCEKKGLCCKFFVVGPVNGRRIDGIVYSERLPYKKVLSYVGRSKCLLNIMQQGTTGITLRDFEAFNFGCNILTNNISNSLTELISKNRIFDLNDDNLENKITSLKAASILMPIKSGAEKNDSYFDYLEGLLTDFCNEK